MQIYFKWMSTIGATRYIIHIIGIASAPFCCNAGFVCESASTLLPVVIKCSSFDLVFILFFALSLTLALFVLFDFCLFFLSDKLFIVHKICSLILKNWIQRCCWYFFSLFCLTRHRAFCCCPSKNNIRRIECEINWKHKREEYDVGRCCWNSDNNNEVKHEKKLKQNTRRVDGTSKKKTTEPTHKETTDAKKLRTFVLHTNE